jgi:type I restriction enzyme S subunit
VRFKQETEFQDTEIGKIPKEWRIVKLNRIAQIIMGQSPPSETYNKDGIGMPFLQGKMEFGRIYPSPVMYTSNPIKIAESNDVLISVRAPVGDVNIAPYRICIGRGLAAIRFDPNQANYMFFFYYFQSFKERLETLGKGSTFKAITKKDLEELSVVNPPLKEQKSIGEILSTVDRVIEVVDAGVMRLEGLKKALMRELLTGRIRVREENGKPIFYRETEFQYTEIGKIPKGWKIVKLKEILILRNGKRPTLSEEGWIPVYGANGIMGYTTDFLIDNDYTIVIGRVGASGEVHLAQGKIWVSDNTLYSEKYDSSKVFMPFLYYLLKDKKLSRFAHKTTHPIITQSFLNDLPIQLPPLAEQRIIADILLTIDGAIELYHKEKDMLGRLKKGLMYVLLTGRVRVMED